MISGAEFDRLLFDLEQLGSGANVHTINKAINYLRSFYEGSWWMPLDDESRPARLEHHVRMCRIAVNTKDVTLLRDSMKHLM